MPVWGEKKFENQKTQEEPQILPVGFVERTENEVKKSRKKRLSSGQARDCALSQAQIPHIGNSP